jgi:hypothetical protein
MTASNPAESGALVRTGKDETWQRIKSLVLDSVTSPHSKRAYEQALDAFSAGAPRPASPGLAKPRCRPGGQPWKQRVWRHLRSMSGSVP